MLFEDLDTVEDAVVEMFFSQLVPEIFLRAQSRQIRGQKQKAQMAGQTEVVALVPAGAIEHHDHVVVRIAAGNLVEKDLHAGEIDMRQHQTVEAAVLRIHRANAS